MKIKIVNSVEIWKRQMTILTRYISFWNHIFLMGRILIWIFIYQGKKRTISCVSCSWIYISCQFCAHIYANWTRDKVYIHKVQFRNGLNNKHKNILFFWNNYLQLLCREIIEFLLNRGFPRTFLACEISRA